MITAIAYMVLSSTLMTFKKKVPPEVFYVYTNSGH